MDKIKKITELFHDTKKKFGNHMKEDFRGGEMTVTQGIIVHHIHHMGNVRISDLAIFSGFLTALFRGSSTDWKKKN